MIDKELFTQIYKADLNSFNFIEKTDCFLGEGFVDLKDLSSKEILKNKNLLNLVNKEPKALVFINCDFFPFLLQSFPQIILFYSRIKNRSIKLYIQTQEQDKNEYWSNLETFLIKYLTDIGVEFEFLKEQECDGVVLDNWCPIENKFSPLGIRLLNSKTKKYVSNQKSDPFRKIFVARDKSVDQRIDSDSEIQKFFVSQGFEVVYPENFNSFFDQIDYFSQCKVIAGISGSALSNCIFMKPGGTVIELSSIFRPNGNEYPVEIHHYYSIMASVMDHLYFSISNLSGKHEGFLNNEKALSIIKMI
jgi:hypothetical protein